MRQALVLVCVGGADSFFALIFEVVYIDPAGGERAHRGIEVFDPLK